MRHRGRSVRPRKGASATLQWRQAGYATEERVAGTAPEQRLAGLDRDQQALALPIEVLRVLPDEYIYSLAPQIQEEIRRRLRAARRQPDITETPGYAEMVLKLVEAMPQEERLAGLSLEQRLADLPAQERLALLAPEQRLAGLDRDHQTLAARFLGRSLVDSGTATISRRSPRSARRSARVATS